MDDMNTDHNATAILKELSDIKANLASNTTETANIKATIVEIKDDIKDIKNDSVSRREFNDAMKTRDEENKGYYKKIDKLWNLRWMIFGGTAVLAYLIDYLVRIFFKS